MADKPKQPDLPEHAEEGAKPRQAAVAAPPKRKPQRKPPQPLPPWKVLLHNDDENAIPEVVETIRMLTPLSQHEAVARTLEAHHRGVSLLLTTHRERAELYRDQFASRNLTVTIEPA